MRFEFSKNQLPDYSTLPDIEAYVFWALPGFYFVLEIHESFLNKN